MSNLLLAVGQRLRRCRAASKTYVGRSLSALACDRALQAKRARWGLRCSTHPLRADLGERATGSSVLHGARRSMRSACAASISDFPHVLRTSTAGVWIDGCSGTSHSARAIRCRRSLPPGESVVNGSCHRTSGDARQALSKTARSASAAVAPPRLLEIPMGRGLDVSAHSQVLPHKHVSIFAWQARVCLQMYIHIETYECMYVCTRTFIDMYLVSVYMHVSARACPSK